MVDGQGSSKGGSVVIIVVMILFFWWLLPASGAWLVGSQGVMRAESR
jgi:hypothetical protein